MQNQLRIPPEIANNPQAIAHYRQQLARQQQRQQQQPRPVQRKRPAPEADQIRIVKERIDDQIKKDHDLLSFDITPFTSKQDVIDRLLAWHIYYIQPYEYDVDLKLDVERVSRLLESGEEVLKEAEMVDLQMYSRFLDMVQIDDPIF